MSALRILARLIGAAMLVITGVVHLRLYNEGYSNIPKIGCCSF